MSRVIAAMLAAENLITVLDAMPDDAAAAVGARGRQRVNRAFEGIERVALAVQRHRKRLGIVVAANFTNGHGSLRTV
jgi:hypothetical protein